MKHTSSILYLIVVFIISCTAEKGRHPEPSATSSIRDTIKNTDSIFVYEGLPHQTFEAELLTAEKAKNGITGLGGYPFYTPKIQIKTLDLSAFKKIISDSSNYTRFLGEKRCGGFHPDYAVEWSDGDKVYLILFCFGCDEVLIIDGKNTYRYDYQLIDDNKKLFTTYELKRPKQK